MHEMPDALEEEDRRQTDEKAKIPSTAIQKDKQHQVCSIYNRYITNLTFFIENLFEISLYLLAASF